MLEAVELILIVVVFLPTSPAACRYYVLKTIREPLILQEPDGPALKVRAVPATPPFYFFFLPVVVVRVPCACCALPCHCRGEARVCSPRTIEATR